MYFVIHPTQEILALYDKMVHLCAGPSLKVFSKSSPQEHLLCESALHWVP